MRTPSLRAVAACLVCVSSIACTPALNWRVTAIDQSPVTAMMPCKPELVTRPVALAGHKLSLVMRSCKADGVMFALGHARPAESAQLPAMLEAWRAALRASVDTRGGRVDTALPPGLTAIPQAIALHASGRGSDGRPLAVQGVWFAVAGQLHAALLYADVIDPAVAETFFSGLRTR